MVETKFELTRGAKAAAIYLMAMGAISVLGVIFLLTGFSPDYVVEYYRAKSFYFMLGQYSRLLTLYFIFVISGIGLLYKKTWARKTAMIILAVDVVFEGNANAWYLAGGRPLSSAVTMWCVCAYAVWNGFWIYLIFRNRPTRIEEGNATRSTDTGDASKPGRSTARS